METATQETPLELLHDADDLQMAIVNIAGTVTNS
jgi:hypothetical protein